MIWPLANIKDLFILYLGIALMSIDFFSMALNKERLKKIT